MVQGKASCMNAERVQLLESIDFVWSTSKTSSSSQNSVGNIHKQSGDSTTAAIGSGVSRNIQGLSSLSAAADVIAAMHYDGTLDEDDDDDDDDDEH